MDKTLGQRSEAYAGYRLQPNDSTLLKGEAKGLVAEAYEQGWKDWVYDEIRET